MATNLSVPESLLVELKRAAATENRSADEVAAEAVRCYLEDRSWKALIERGRRRTKELGIREEDVPELIADSRREIGERGR